MPWLPRDVVREHLGAHLVEPLKVLGHLPEVAVDAASAAKIVLGGEPPPPVGIQPAEAYVVSDGARALLIAEVKEGRPKAVVRLARGTGKH